MEVQVFGLRKSPETRKALRFFSERRVRAHFVDLAERELAPGELQRFVQKFGVQGLLDRESKRFDQLGLQHLSMSDGRWLDKLLTEPALLRLPLVRRLGQPFGLSVGDAEPVWKTWISSASNTT